MADGSDRSDPAVRASLRLLSAERRHRMGRVSAALALFACAVIGPLVAQPLAGDPGATVGAIIASILLIGCGVMAWPWRWSDSEREHHTVAAVWAEARADAADPTPWTRFAAWAEARSDRVDLILVSHAGSAGSESVVGSFSKVVIRTVDADAIAEAATAMEALREEAARREERAQQRYREEVEAAQRKPLDDALRKVDEVAAAEQRQAEERMLDELAEQEDAERQAQAAAIARALRRP